LSWFDIIKEPLISIPKGSVRIKKPKKIETNDECLPKVKEFLKNVSRIIANEPDFTIFFEKDGGHCYVEDFNIPEEFACEILEGLNSNRVDYDDLLAYEPSIWGEAFLDGELENDELNYTARASRFTNNDPDLPLMKIETSQYLCELHYSNYQYNAVLGGIPAKSMGPDYQLTSERWSEVFAKIKDVFP
tara:strand:- start:43 stop:609 length:567 start_codon:yes stop_codon:yes gene_type:complete